MITKNDALKFIKPGVKIMSKVTYNGREEINVYTVTKVIDIGDNIIVFIDKYGKERTVNLENIENIKVQI